MMGICLVKCSSAYIKAGEVVPAIGHFVVNSVLHCCCCVGGGGGGGRLVGLFFRLHYAPFCVR